MVNLFRSAVLSAALPPPGLNIDDSSSIQGVARTLAAGAMTYYPGTSAAFADVVTPYYWWETGALFGAMLDYSHLTGDTTYDTVITTALSAQVIAPDYNLMVPDHYGDEGNDDQAFWGFAIMSAAESNFPQSADASLPAWLTVGENLWNSLASRWNDTACGGGLLWQIFASNPNGLTYKNSVSNGGLFQLSARLYRATSNETYLEWANKVWDWSTGVGFIDSSYNVYDGADVSDNCSAINPVTFSYSAGIYLYGAAVLANVSDSVWVDRTTGLLEASRSFFSPFENATNIMYEHACEQVDTCNTDMKSFKGYLSRFMWKSTQMVASILPTVQALLEPSAMAAATACSGGDDGTTCGQKWYVGGYDASVGLGQEMSALETVQGLLVSQAAPPLKAGEIQDVREGDTSITASAVTSAASSVTSAASSVTSAASATRTTTVIIQMTTIVLPPVTVAAEPVSTAASAPLKPKRSSTSTSGASNVTGSTWVGLGLLTAVLVWGMV